MRASGRVSIGPGAYVAPDVDLEEGVDVGPNAVVLGSEDSRDQPTVIERRAVIGANATVLAGLRVGFEAQVRPGSVVTRSVPARAIAGGNPASIVGYVDAGTQQQGEHRPAVPEDWPRDTRVRGVSLLQLETASDMRGALAVADAPDVIPFEPRRWFLVYGVPSAETRGEHAHRRCHQLLIAAHGTVHVLADDGQAREEFVLDRPSLGLLLPAMTWGVQYRYSPDAVLLVLASEPYDPDDYIRDYSEYLALTRQPGLAL